MMDSHDLDGDGFGDNLQRLTFDESFNCDAFADVGPQWSPTSNLIAFTSTRSGYFDIWLVNADDPTDLRNVTQTPEEYEDQPSWSPDGTQVIFRSSKSGAYEFYALPVPPPASPAAAQREGTTRTAPRQLTFDGKPKQQGDWGRVRPRLATHVLTVRKSGHGRVASTPRGITCGTDCAQTFGAGTTVTLTARPAAGYSLAGWGGACDGTSLTCTVTMDAAKRVFARFVAIA